MLGTCNADVTLGVTEHEDRVILEATHHDWYRFLTGSDDCTDDVVVDLAQPLGERAITTPDGDGIATVRP